MESQILEGELIKVKEEFIKVISSFGEQEINNVPFEGSWTPGQVGDHVVMSDLAVLKWLKGSTESTSREIDENVGKLKSIFLDFTIKMSSPNLIVPTQSTYDKASIIKSIRKTEEEFVKIINTCDLSQLCLSIEVKELGVLTRLELISFNIFHTQRHTHQLQKMKEER